jgi:hypothetical protein
MYGNMNGSPWNVKMHESREVVNVRFPPFLAYGDGIKDDSDSLQAAIDKAVEKGIPVRVPKGTYRTTKGLVAVATNFVMYGDGGTLSVIKVDGYGYDALVIGPGVSGSGVQPSGWIGDLDIEGPTSWITGTTAALKLDGMRQFQVANVTVKRMPIGFDAINNCYGSSWNNCRFDLGGLGVNIRTGPQSGSDLAFDKMWLRGKDGSIWVAPDAGGIHFENGQLTGGNNQGADNHDVGVVVLGKDYLTGTTGNVGNVDFENIDFEGSMYINQIRTYGQVNLQVAKSSFLSTALTSAAEKPLGIIKMTNALQSRITLITNTVSGDWKSAKSIDIQGQGSVLNIIEMNTNMVNGTVRFNGQANANEKTLLQQSGLKMGISFFREQSVNKIMLGGMWFRDSAAGNVETSIDNGATWKIFKPTTSGARPTTNLIAGQMHFDIDDKPVWRNIANTAWVNASGVVTAAPVAP